MAWQFRKRVKIAKGVNLNLSKRGVGVSAGVKGLRVGANSKGVYRSTSIPGTGLYNIEYMNEKKQAASSKAPATMQQNISSSTQVNQQVRPIPAELTVSTKLFSAMLVVSFFLLFFCWQAGIIAFIASFIYNAKSPNMYAKKMFQEAIVALQAGDGMNALNKLNELKEYDSSIDLDHYTVEAHSLTGNHKQVIEHFSKLHEVDPDDTNIILKLMYESYNAKDYNKVVDYIKKLPDEIKNDVSIINLLGDSFIELGKPDLAVAVLSTGPIRKRKLDEQLMRFFYLYGLALKQTGQNKKAITQLKKIYAADQSYYDVSTLLEELNSEPAGRYEDA